MNVNAPIKDKGTVVVKVGSGSIAGINSDGVVDIKEEVLKNLVEGICDLRDSGYKVVAVLSGAVAAGMAELGESERPTDPNELALRAALGQPRLMEMLKEHFRLRTTMVAQVLPERETYHDRDRRQFLIDNTELMLANGIVPVFNENDPVVHTELTFGDNDYVALLEAIGIKADYLLLLTDQQGILTADPKFDHNAQLIECIDEVTPELFAAIGAGSGLGSGGGNITKLSAGDIARHSGVRPIIASVDYVHNLVGLLEGSIPATRFTLRNDVHYDLDIACDLIDKIAQHYEQSDGHFDVAQYFVDIRRIERELSR